ncbi:hypothetical protein OIE71_01900 [Streptomyces sp. NBC_01725]|uniref:hypothetical protein n=1 Tax=Streptomyces sp. NBC_01725 TaxID=2975923 RepID=UPI002E29B84E|nr:hypothetical protein [Streptomyces sp. NBC_01725]
MTNECGVPESLIALQRTLNAAAEEARARGSSPEDWRPWVEAAAVAENAFAEHAAAAGVSADKVRSAAERAARGLPAHTDPEERTD